MLVFRSCISALLLAIILLGLTATVDAQQPQPTRRPVPSPAPTRAPATQPFTAEDVAAIRAELETIREYDDRLIQTMQWALSGVGALVLALLGLNYFGAFRLAERDRSAIREELVAEQRRELDEMHQSLDKRAERLERELRETSAKAARQAAETQFTELRRRVYLLQLDLLTSEAESWLLQRNVPGNALRAFSEVLSVALELGWNHQIAHGLEGMRAALKAGANPGAQDVADFNTLFDKVPEEFATDIEALRRQIQATRSAAATDSEPSD